MVQISKRLVVQKQVVNNEIESLLGSMDSALAEYYCKNNNYEKGLSMYRDIINKQIGGERNVTINQYINHSLAYAENLFKEKKWIETIEVLREVMKYPGFPVNVYKHVGICMKHINNADLAIRFLKYFEEISPDKEDVYIYLADLTFSDIKDNIKAIEYYEKALPKNSSNYGIYNMLGHLYSTCYKDKFKDKQIEYLTKAYELAPNNRIVVKNLAYVLGKFDEVEKADEFYAKLMKLNPTHSDLHAYGAYLVRHRRFIEGFKELQHRFLKEDLNHCYPPIFTLKKKRWNAKTNLSGKHLLIHYEQGFGDSIMFARFIDEAKKRCGKLSMIVQNSLIPLFRDSFDIDIYDERDLEKINYDYLIASMDLPILCETTPETIPNTTAYMRVPQDRIDAYRKEHINDNNKLKIGIAYEGTLASVETNRDLPLKYLHKLMCMPNVEVYSFQVDDLFRQMDQLPPEAQLIRLGKTFKNWEDTACAMNCMDLMITSDNGVMNLAGALGIKTFAIFNRVVEWRWFDVSGDDIAWYKSVKPFQAPTTDAWDVPVNAIMLEVDKLVAEKMNPTRQIKEKTPTQKTTLKMETKPIKKVAAKSKSATKRKTSQKTEKTE